ncbi:MAG: zf-HC2 domain-containing protein [Planctomycetota bacterium]
MKSFSNELCSSVRNHLPLFLDGELPVKVSRQLSRHLEACPACRRAKQLEEQRLLETVACLVSAEPSPELSQRIHAALAELASWPVLWPASWRPAATLGRWKAVAAVALMLVGGWLLFHWQQEGTDSDSQVSPRVAFSQTILLGDVDGDGRFGLADLGLLVGYLREKYDSLPSCLAAGDFDGDGTLTLSDSVCAAQILAESRAPTLIAFNPQGALSCSSFCP